MGRSPTPGIDRPGLDQPAGRRPIGAGHVFPCRAPGRSLGPDRARRLLAPGKPVGVPGRRSAARRARAMTLLRAILAAALPAEGDGPATEFPLFQPGWNEANDGRKPWELKDAAAVVAASPGEIMIDYDHGSAKAGGSSEAAGWARLEARDGGVWAVGIQWTDTGAAAIAAKRYRYISPEFLFDQQSREIAQVAALALVNRPGLRFQAERALAHEDAGELVAALAARLGLEADAGAAEIAAHLDQERRAEALALGLEADATQGAVCAAKTALRAAGLDRFGEAERVVARAVQAGAVTPAQRSSALALASAAPAAFAEFVGQPARFAHLSRAVAPAGVRPAQAGAATAEVAARMCTTPERLQAARKQLENTSERTFA
ncbi:MAG: hypothetical protein F4160_14535 [Rhodospirillaceae bacterium]|nr:hypothetical protein [Rhodospirillaceae bacterium]